MPDPQRARSFGAVAAEYARHRPRYPQEAVDLALHPAWPPGRVLDLGAGTGVLTAALLARGLDVVAVEPDPGMLAQLHAELPGADAREGSAEAIPLPAGSVDAVLVGQALHWFDLTLATPEMARVLRPGGVLAGLWNSADPGAGWPHELGTVAGSAHPPNPRGAGYDVQMPGEPFFEPAERADVRWSRPMTVDSYLADVATHSWALTAEPAERDAAFARMRAYLAARPETSSGTFELPMLTLVWRTLRR
ncbi:class I SAM-dependent methyltransferase [Pseudonocardia sp. KRD291]|uniref:class I SAM-dependent methyltransferase n=1 Tax=Pseudonocardia sp. KRD291 TaxID=2792007 RepID=UPI001C49DDF8|nr:class I SAM-dependent methyltransferase [Pseudonocardia sp. KRD291]MBW0105522.1 class I SAM-dependent methyltransferase [Pseudonocardia sp. KRD291]